MLPNIVDRKTTHSSRGAPSAPLPYTHHRRFNCREASWVFLAREALRSEGAELPVNISYVIVKESLRVFFSENKNIKRSP